MFVERQAIGAERQAEQHRRNKRRRAASEKKRAVEYMRERTKPAAAVFPGRLLAIDRRLEQPNEGRRMYLELDSVTLAASEDLVDMRRREFAAVRRNDDAVAELPERRRLLEQRLPVRSELDRADRRRPRGYLEKLEIGWMQQRLAADGRPDRGVRDAVEVLEVLREYRRRGVGRAEIVRRER